MKPRRKQAAGVVKKLNFAIPGDPALIGAKVKFKPEGEQRFEIHNEVFEIVGFQKAWGYDDKGNYTMISAMRVVNTTYADTFGRPMHYYEAEFLSMNN